MTLLLSPDATVPLDPEVEGRGRFVERALAGGRGERAGSTRHRVAIIGVLALVLAVWVPHLDDRFGPSYDGYNGAAWGSAVDAIQDTGWVDSKAGTVRPGEVYGNHPPLLTLTLVGTTRLLGEGHWQMRLPIALASLTALLLLFRLAVALGARRGAAALGMLVVGLSPMLLTYGPMIDTWILGFPFGVLVLLALAERRATACRHVGLAACVLCSWQGALLVALAFPLMVRRVGWRFATTGAVAMVALGIFTLWVGAPSAGLELGWPFDGLALERATRALGLAVVTVPLAMRCRDRAVAGVAIAAPLIYAVMFTHHADIHPYWTFWLLVPVAVGVAMIAVDRRGVLVALIVLTVGFAPASDLLDYQRGLNATGTELAEAIDTTDQDTLLVVGGDDAAWAAYETGLPTRLVDIEDVPAGRAFLVSWSETPPGVDCSIEAPRGFALCRVR